jgi:hypothetical protein
LLWLLVPILLVAMLSLQGCFRIGGGATRHNPPKSVPAGEPILLRLRVSVTDPQRGDITERWTDVTCHHRLIGQDQWIAAPMVTENVERSRIHFVTTLPTELIGASSGVEY